MKIKLPEWFKKNFLYKPDKTILDQQYKILLTKYEKIKFERNLTSDSNQIVSKLEILFKHDQTWTNFSQIELYLVSLYSDDEIAMELKIKMLEAVEKLPHETFHFYEDELREERSISDRKILLNSLNEKLQITDDLEDLQKTYIALTRIRTSFLFFFAILMFFAVDQLPAITNLLSITKGSKGDAILTAMASGWLGTAFSMLIGLKTKLTISSLQDLKVIHRIDYIFSRTIIGLTSGLLLYYFFQSQLLTGTLFPQFKEIDPIFDTKSYALLIVWCFLSGFSEKLIPDLLSNTEKNITNQ
jgi:hypothetical protein